MRYNVAISDNILKWIISGLNPNETKPGIIETLISWENNTQTPTYNKVLNISRATGIPLGYFFLKTPPKENLSFINYRTVNSTELKNPSAELKTTMLDMELIQEWLHNKLINDGVTKNSYVGSLKNNNDIDVLATIIRNELNIQKDWYIRIKTSEDSFALIDEYAPLIFINSNDSINGRIFSLLHEYVHIGLGENSLYNDRCGCSFNVKTTETICNKVAAEILVPQEKFIEQWNKYFKETNFEVIVDKLSKYFKCGTTVIARKALDNNFISSEFYQNIAQNAVRNYKKNKSRGGDFYKNLNSKIDSNFLGYLISSVEQGKTLYTEAFRLTNTNKETFKNLKSQFEGGLL